MTGSVEKPQKTVSSERFHNENCFNYLRNLDIHPRLLSKLPPSLSAPLQVILNQNKDQYNPQFAYADLYTHFFDYIDENIDRMYQQEMSVMQEKIDEELRLVDAQIANYELIKGHIPENQKAFMAQYRKSLESRKLELSAKTILDDFVISIYANDNSILENTYEAIKDIPLTQTPMSKGIEKSIESRTKDKGTAVNTQSQSPAQAGSLYGLITAGISGNYKPQHTTSLSTIRRYRYNQGSTVTEYRFGTQGQRHEGKERISPLYERFLDAQKARFPDKKITHIYFNNLGRDRDDMEGEKEKALTEELEKLEGRHSNVAVITLPADKGFMDKEHYKGTKPKDNCGEVKEEFLKIASQDPLAASEIKDFYISENIRKLLFKDENNEYSLKAEKEKLGELLKSSFKAMGIDDEDKTLQLSDAQQQAVWFHFIKYELTNHIIDTLNPASINFSCKDAIDRGGVSSAYYNLIKSFDSDAPMNREEFDRALHAAPTMVKGRGMNHHLKVIWNTVNEYVNNKENYDKLIKNPEKAWLIEWRDLNCPHPRVELLLNERVTQLKIDLQTALNNPTNIDNRAVISKGLEILTKIEEQTNIGVSGKRLLLEAAVRTSSMALNPSLENTQAYTKLADKIIVDHPTLNIIGGMMKSFVGKVLYGLTFGTTDFGLIKAGEATAQAGYNAEARKEIQMKMKEQIQDLKQMQSTEELQDKPEDPVDQGIKVY